MRRRVIDPEFWQDSRIGKLPVVVRLLFIATWSQADDAGILDADPEQIAAAVFPYDRMRARVICDYLRHLEAEERLLRYECGDHAYYLIKHFHRHQRIDRPTPSKRPRPPDAVLDQLDESCRHLVISRTRQPDSRVSPSRHATPSSTKTRREHNEASSKPLSEDKSSKVKQSEEKQATPFSTRTRPSVEITAIAQEMEAGIAMYADGRIQDGLGNVYASVSDYHDRKRAIAEHELARRIADLPPSSRMPPVPEVAGA